LTIDPPALPTAANYLDSAFPQGCDPWWFGIGIASEGLLLWRNFD